MSKKRKERKKKKQIQERIIRAGRCWAVGLSMVRGSSVPRRFLVQMFTDAEDFYLVAAPAVSVGLDRSFLLFFWYTQFAVAN